MGRAAGFDGKITSVWFASWVEAGYGGRFEAYAIGWAGRVDPDGNMYQFLHTGGTFNYGHYSNQNMGTLRDQARQTNDPTQRKAPYTEVWAQER